MSCNFHSTLRSLGRMLLLLVLVASYHNLRGEPASAVEYRGVVYVALPDILAPEFLNGKSELVEYGRVIDISTTGGKNRLIDGGDEVVGENGTTHPLQSPVLVLDSVHFVPARELSAYLPYVFEPGPPAQLRAGSVVLSLDVDTVKADSSSVTVQDLKSVRRPVVLTQTVTAWTSLVRAAPTTHTLSAGTPLLIRREVTLNGVPHVLATCNDESLRTYAIASSRMQVSSAPDKLDGSHLGRIYARLSRMAETSSSICHGLRSDLSRTVALTADLCWSLRPYEEDFFKLLPRLAVTRGKAAITLFLTGRWMQQHPEEMQKFIDLSLQPGVEVTWGLHSWIHPKEQPFMNAFSPQYVKEDTLRLEHDMLEWGIIPSIFYRYPGLIHDDIRLRTLLEMDLISIDCDSWVTGMRFNRPPNRLVAHDGSILLIHGNGNEPNGIPRLYEWLLERPDWRLDSLNRFVAPADPSDDVELTTATKNSDDWRPKRYRRRR